MCGLAGIFGDSAPRSGLLGAMAPTIAHRGPYLADQLLLPFLVVGGGTFATEEPSQQT